MGTEIELTTRLTVNSSFPKRNFIPTLQVIKMAGKHKMFYNDVDQQAGLLYKPNLRGDRIKECGSRE
jgi:hypothetical protein